MLKTRIKKRRLTHNKHAQGESKRVFRKKVVGRWSEAAWLKGLLNPLSEDYFRLKILHVHPVLCVPVLTKILEKFYSDI